MTDLVAWQKMNEEYLAAALASLRLRLERVAPQKPTAPAERAAVPRRKGFSAWDRLLGRRAMRPAQATPPIVPTATPVASEQDVVAAAAAVRRLAASDPPPALGILQRRFGLSRFEQDVLLLATAMDLDTRVAPLCARAQDDPGRAYPTYALAFALFEEPAWDALSPERPLRYWRLIEITPSGPQPLTASAIRADERIVNYVKGLNHLDDRLLPLLEPVVAPEAPAELPPSQQGAVDQVVRRLERRSDAGRWPTVQLLGGDGASKQLVASRIAAALGLGLYRLPAELVPAQATDAELVARLWQREAMLLPVALYVDHQEGDTGASDPHAAGVARFLSRVGGLTFLATRDLRANVGAWPFAVDVRKPTAAEQRHAWESVLGDMGRESAVRVSAQFDLSLAQIHEVARTALRNGAARADALDASVWEACLGITRPQLDLLAQRIDARATWDDLVLPGPETTVLHQIASQVGQRTRVYGDWGFARKMNRGLGINALFAGDSGTGKTMAAEVIANDLDLSLYRIDLSAVISKYIGETEKNLRRLFDAAEDGGAILFFDECDAIFGKRSEVKDSHDRYANIEINYLLQRMEAYRGLAILATNMKSALDRAFMRRLRFTVDFPFPGPAERKLIWRKVFPAETRVSGLDLDRLARLNLTGGSIHNIALNAAFLAAPAGEPVAMPQVLEATRLEYRKLERPINEAEFRWREPVEGVA